MQPLELSSDLQRMMRRVSMLSSRTRQLRSLNPSGDAAQWPSCSTRYDGELHVRVLSLDELMMVEEVTFLTVINNNRLENNLVPLSQGDAQHLP